MRLQAAVEAEWQVSLLQPDPLQVSPGECAVLGLLWSYSGVSEQEVTGRLVLPRGWILLNEQDEVANLRSESTGVFLWGFTVSDSHPAGEACVQIELLDADAQVLYRTKQCVDVEKVQSVGICVNEPPSVLPENHPRRLTYILQNQGNTTELLDVNAFTTGQSVCSLSYERVLLQPGQEATVDVALWPEASCHFDGCFLEVRDVCGKTLAKKGFLFDAVKKGGKPWFELNYIPSCFRTFVGQADESFFGGQNGVEQAMWIVKTDPFG